jgi:hypothetical protein
MASLGRRKMAAVSRLGARRCARFGLSLIEVAATMTACMMLLAATVTALVALQQADRGRSDGATDERSVAQLIDRLRDDLHAAQSFSWNERDDSLHLSMPAEGEVVYQRAEKHWERRVVGADSAWAYRLPARLRGRFAPAAGAAGDLVRVEFYSTQKLPGDDEHQPVRAELTATVGRDGRLLVK